MWRRKRKSASFCARTVTAKKRNACGVYLDAPAAPLYTRGMTRPFFTLPLLVSLIVLSLSSRNAQAAPPGNAARMNPAPAEVSTALDAAAKAHRIPTVLLKSLAWRESRWCQVGENGVVVEPEAGHVGLLGVWDGGPAHSQSDGGNGGRRMDAARLRTDWRYNVDEGAKQLELCWDRAPIIGNGRLDDGRNLLECWYFALGRYQFGAGGEKSNTFANSVLEAAKSGGEGRWPGVVVTRPSAEKLSWGKNVFGPPVPWHFGDVVPRKPADPVVSLPVPYLSQVYDSPDDFDGSGSCGPTSMLMVLAFYQKIAPNPVRVTESYAHETLYGKFIPQVDAKVCEPNLGAVHVKMLDYLRPQFPGVAIWYNEKATWERVKAELDAHRPVILGTQVTGAGHIMVARGYLTDGRLLINDPAGDREQAARKGGPEGGWSPTGVRYWNGDGNKAVYEWDALEVRWLMTFGPQAVGSDKAEDAK